MTKAQLSGFVKGGNRSDGSWNDERVSRLEKLWADGFSASQVAAQLGGVTRNSVISKVHRLGLPGRTTTVRFDARKNGGKHQLHPWHKPKPAPPKPISGLPKLPTTPLPPPAETDIPRIATVDLEQDHCRWVCIPDVRQVSPYEPIFCGAPKAKGLAYCHAHVVRAYQIPSPRQFREDNVIVLAKEEVAAA